MQHWIHRAPPGGAPDGKVVSSKSVPINLVSDDGHLLATPPHCAPCERFALDGDDPLTDIEDELGLRACLPEIPEFPFPAHPDVATLAARVKTVQKANRAASKSWHD